MKRVLYVFVALWSMIIVLSSCDMQAVPSPSTAVPTGIASSVESMIFDSEIEYTVDQNSIYWHNQLGKPMVYINENTRKQEPISDFSLDSLANEMANITQSNRLWFGDFIVPYLLNSKSIEISDEELRDALMTSEFEIIIYTFSTLDFQHRIIMLSPNMDRSGMHYTGNAYCAIQSWNEEKIYAQTLFENMLITFDGQMNPIRDICSSARILTFWGQGTINHYKNGSLIPMVLGWEWNGSVWIPFEVGDWIELTIVEECVEIESIEIKKDGILLDTVAISDDEGASVTYRQDLSFDFSDSDNVSIVRNNDSKEIALLTWK